MLYIHILFFGASMIESVATKVPINAKQ